MTTALSLQGNIGNAAVVGMLARGGPGLAAVTVQRSPEDVFRLIGAFQGRLAKGPGFEAAALQILTEFEDFAKKGNDPDTRAELRTRATLMKESLLSEPVSVPTRKRIYDVLSKLADTGGPAAPVTLDKDSKAHEVLAALEEGSARLHGLRTKWYVSSFDKRGGYSTAYSLGQECSWEIHAHRKANQAAETFSVQQTITVGTAQKSQRWVSDVSKLEAVGIPKLHRPAQAKNLWAPM